MGQGGRVPGCQVRSGRGPGVGQGGREPGAVRGGSRCVQGGKSTHTQHVVGPGHWAADMKQPSRAPPPSPPPPPPPPPPLPPFPTCRLTLALPRQRMLHAPRLPEHPAPATDTVTSSRCVPGSRLAYLAMYSGMVLLTWNLWGNGLMPLAFLAWWGRTGGAGRGGVG